MSSPEPVRRSRRMSAKPIVGLRATWSSDFGEHREADPPGPPKSGSATSKLSHGFSCKPGRCRQILWRAPFGLRAQFPLPVHLLYAALHDQCARIMFVPPAWVAQICSISGRIWPRPGQYPWSKSGHIWPYSGQTWPLRAKFRRCRAKLAQVWAASSRSWSKHGRGRPKFGPILVDCGVRRSFVEFGPSWADSGGRVSSGSGWARYASDERRAAVNPAHHHHGRNRERMVADRGPWPPQVLSHSAAPAAPRSGAPPHKPPRQVERTLGPRVVRSRSPRTLRATTRRRQRRERRAWPREAAPGSGCGRAAPHTGRTRDLPSSMRRFTGAFPLQRRGRGASPPGPVGLRVRNRRADGEPAGPKEAASPSGGAERRRGATSRPQHPFPPLPRRVLPTSAPAESAGGGWAKVVPGGRHCLRPMGPGAVRSDDVATGATGRGPIGSMP